MSKHTSPAPFSPRVFAAASEPESLAELRRDCARMGQHWRVAAPAAAVSAPPAPAMSPVPPPPASMPHGISVPQRSVRLLEGMSEYGD